MESIQCDGDDNYEVQATETEGAALTRVWNDLGPLIAFAIQKLGREAGIALCRGLESGDLIPEWTLRPGLATCTIWHNADLLYRFAFDHQPSRFVFTEVEGKHAN